jgi:hypothetical protein
MTLVIIDKDQPVQVVQRVPEGDAPREAPLCDLIFDHPTILPVAEFEPGIGRVIAVAKEVHLPGAGFIDVLLISEHGRLIAVECKLWRNPQARREVVGRCCQVNRSRRRPVGRAGRSPNQKRPICVPCASQGTRSTTQKPGY